MGPRAPSIFHHLFFWLVSFLWTRFHWKFWSQRSRHRWCSIFWWDRFLLLFESKFCGDASFTRFPPPPVIVSCLWTRVPVFTGSCETETWMVLVLLLCFSEFPKIKVSRRCFISVFPAACRLHTFCVIVFSYNVGRCKHIDSARVSQC